MDFTAWAIVIVGWVISICGVGTIVSKAINRRIENISEQQKTQKARQEAVEHGVQALLRSNMIAIYNKYTEKGSVPIYERENIAHLYEEYKTLGGNGVIESLMEKLSDLPTPKKSDEGKK